VLLLALVALGLRATFSRRTLWMDWPWKWLLLGIMGWRLVGLAWCTSVRGWVRIC
jgi:hypothetical protein